MNTNEGNKNLEDKESVGENAKKYPYGLGLYEKHSYRGYMFKSLSTLFLFPCFYLSSGA